MTTIVTRAGKGSPLTNTEMDTNLTNLNSYKVEQDISGNATITGDVYLTGSGKRITGDFSNATTANRVMFQTSTVNGTTGVAAIPNGTGTAAAINAHNSSDPNNSSIAQLRATASAIELISANAGTGTYLPMTFYTGGTERMRIDTSGNVLVDGNNLNLFSAKSLADNGYQKLPSGLIVQWGSVTCSTGGDVTWTYPIAFSSVVRAGPIGVLSSVAQFSNIGAPTLTSVPVRAFDITGARSANTVHLFAIGY